MSRPLVEICVGDLAGALAAQDAGADRVELCADLGHGGTTPGPGTIAVALRRLRHADLRVMVRPRGGDFVPDDAEAEAMLADIAAVRALAGASPGARQVGLVLGVLTPDAELDIPLLARLVEAAGPLPVTLHKAVDLVADQRRALDQAVDLGIDRVLTSGGAPTALEGAARLADLHTHAAGRIGIVVAGGIRPQNVAEVVAATGAKEIHLRAPGPRHWAESTDPGVVRVLLDRLR